MPESPTTLRSLITEFHRHCELESARDARFDTLLQQVCKELEAFNKMLSVSSNGKSLSERITIIEQSLITLHAKFEDRQKLRLGFWVPIICSFITSATALVVALIRL